MIAFDKYEKQGDYHWKLFQNEPDCAYSQHARFCAEWVKERPVLDIGCGDGLITSLFGNAAGLDISPLAVTLAQSHKVNAVDGSIYSLSGVLKRYPAVFLGDIIEHLSGPLLALTEVRKVMEPQGLLYISTPPKQASLSDYHFAEYSPDELVNLALMAGFELVEPILVKPEWVEMYGKFKVARFTH